MEASNSGSEFFQFAFVNLNKPYDVAHAAQLAIASGMIESHFIGDCTDYSHPKVRNKVTSWNISNQDLASLKYSTHETLSDFKSTRRGRIIGTSPKEGNNSFLFDWDIFSDIITIGGADGISKENYKNFDELVTIPSKVEVPFLTIPTVMPILYAILMSRLLKR